MAVGVTACGGDAGASGQNPTATRPPAQPTSTATLEPYIAPTETIAVPTATVEPTASATPRPTRIATIAVVEPRLVTAVMQPLNVDAGATLSVSARTTGPVQRVEVYLGSGLPGSAGPIDVTLSGAGGSWSGTVPAPQSPGEYHYTVGVYSNGKRSIIDNDGWNIKVLAPVTQAQPLPDDIPLVPPFGWGNPVSASFTANGRSYSGSEITSTTRSDVTASYVAQWYENRLPAAGWTLLTPTVPSGATSFTMVGTSGTRVCVVQYAAGTVHIFYA